MRPPISDPFAAPDSSKDAHSFRGSFLRSFIGYFILFFCLSSPVTAAFVLPILPLRYFGIAFWILVALVSVPTLLLSTMSLFFSVEVGAEQLKGHDFWAVKRAVSWSEITRVRGASFVFRYALISTPQKRNCIWLPLIFSDMPGFARAVEEVAPAENPLRLWLEKRGFGA